MPGYFTCYKERAGTQLPWVPEPLVIEVRTRRGGSGHTSIQPHFGEFNIWTLFVIGLNLCESFHWLADERRLTNEKTHINLDQSQTEFKYWTHQSEAGCLCDQSLLVVSTFLSQEALAPRVAVSTQLVNQTICPKLRLELRTFKIVL